MRCTCLFKGGLNIPGTTTHASGFLSLARPHDRCEYATSRAGSDGRFKAENEASSLCKFARGEPSRGGAGTWRRQVPSKAAPRCRRVRVQDESTRIQLGEPWPGRTCGPRVTRWGDGPASPAQHHGRPALRSQPGTARNAGRHEANKGIVGFSGPVNKDGGERGAFLIGVAEPSSVGGRRTAHRSRVGK